jgi:hypothetical protein
VVAPAWRTVGDDHITQKRENASAGDGGHARGKRGDN